MRITLGILTMVCSTAIADPRPPIKPRRSIPVTRQLKPAANAKQAKQTSASYRVRLTPMPLRFGF